VGAGNYLKEAIIVSIIEATGMKVAIPNFCENEWFIALGIFYQPSKEGDCYTDLIVMLIIEKRAIYLICFLQPRKWMNFKTSLLKDGQKQKVMHQIKKDKCRDCGRWYT